MEKIIMPDGWHEVPVGMFQETLLIENNKYYDINFISIISNSDPEDIRKITPSDFDLIKNKVSWSNTLPTNEYKTDIIIDGVDYYLVKLKSLSNGEWIDLDNWCHDSNENLHKIFALLYRPIGEEYNTEKMNERAELFKEKLMISDVYGTLIFFLIIGTQYQELIKDYTTQSTMTN